MTWFMLPAIIGILVKLYLLFGVRRNVLINHAVIGLVSVLALHNLSELLLFNSFVKSLDANHLIRAYYVCSIMVSSYALYYALSLSKFNSKVNTFLFCAIPALCLSLTVLMSNFIIAGASELSYTITALKGNQYWVYPIFLIASMVLTISCLLVNYRNSESPDHEVRNFYALASMTPLLGIPVVVVGLMSVGIAVNATFVFPIASTLFLLILIKGKYSLSLHRDPRGIVPNSLESQLATIISQANAQYSFEKISHKELMASIEKAVIQYKYLKNDRNVSRTANSMKIDRSTLYNKFKALEVRESVD